MLEYQFEVRISFTTLIYIYIYISVILTACVAQLENTSDIQAVGHEFKPRSDH